MKFLAGVLLGVILAGAFVAGAVLLSQAIRASATQCVDDETDASKFTIPTREPT